MNQLWQKIKGNKIILGFLIFDLLAIAFLIALPIIDSFNTATVSIQVVPLDSKITINGKTYENNNTYNILPSSNAKIEISHDGLEIISYTQDLNNNTTTNIVKYLTGKDQDFSYYEYKDHEKDLEQLITIASNFPKESKLQAFVKWANIKNDTPIIQDDICKDGIDVRGNCYSVFINAGYYQDSDNKLCIAVTDSSGEKHPELYEELIKNKGYNLKDYKVIYEYGTMEYLNESSK